jgi:hypothetical protein
MAEKPWHADMEVHTLKTGDALNEATLRHLYMCKTLHDVNNGTFDWMN